MSVHKLWITFPMFLQKMRFPHKAAVVHTSYAHSVRNGGEGRLCNAGGAAGGRQIVNCALFGGIFSCGQGAKRLYFSRADGIILNTERAAAVRFGAPQGLPV